jgi:hypothetical protein
VSEKPELPKSITERQFCAMWIHTLSAAMLKSGRGFRMDSPKRRPPAGASHYRGDRREDKPGTTKLSRRLLQGAK